MEVCNGITFYNGSLAEKLKFLPKGLEFIEAKRLAGYILNGLSRVRDLVTPDKFLTCSKGASEKQIGQLRALQQRVNSVTLAIADRSPPDPRSPEGVSSLLQQLAEVSSGTPCRSRASTSSPPGFPAGLSPLLRELQDASHRGANRQESQGCTSYQIRGYLCFTIEME